MALSAGHSTLGSLWDVLGLSALESLIDNTRQPVSDVEYADAYLDGHMEADLDVDEDEELQAQQLASQQEGSGTPDHALPVSELHHRKQHISNEYPAEGRTHAHIMSPSELHR